jgi:hypothetical protein
MVAEGFALGDESFGGLVGKSLVDHVENLLLGHGGVFQTADLLAGKGRQTLNAPVNNRLHRGIREADELERDRFAAEDIDLIRLRHFQNLRIGVARAGQIHCRIGVGKFVMVRSSGFQKGETQIIGSASVFQLGELGDLQIAGLEGFHFVQRGGPHSRLIEGTVIGLRMFLAAK